VTEGLVYFPDMHRGSGWFTQDDKEYIYVGWLDDLHSFPTGELDTVIREKIRALCNSPEILYAGFHTCAFCPEPGNPEEKYQVFRLRQSGLGSGDILLRNSDGSCFVAPNLLIHYVEVHGYLPPAPFLDAGVNYPVPGRK
jgi:hypothetical protein